jgi:hypothetical protein
LLANPRYTGGGESVNCSDAIETMLTTIASIAQRSLVLRRTASQTDLLSDLSHHLQRFAANL